MNDRNETEKIEINQLTMSAILLALSLILPLMFGQNTYVGNAFCPMHLPVFLCGFICGPYWSLTVGFIAPILRYAIFGMPLLIPTGIAMSFELATYGYVAGTTFRKCGRKKKSIFFSLAVAMVMGRMSWTIVRFIMFQLGKSEFGIRMVVSSTIVHSIPGIIAQFLLVPVIVSSMQRIKF